MATAVSLQKLSDRDLVSVVKRLAHAERHATAALIASLAEMDARRLYLGEGCASLFVYCTRVLHLSEHAAYGRIEAARAVRRFPMVLDRLEGGELTLTNLCLLRPHLTDANCTELFDAARHTSKRNVERLIATIAPRPDVPTVVRKLPVRSPADRDAPSTPKLLTLAANVSAPLARNGVDHVVAACAATSPMPVPVAPLPPRPATAATSPLSADRYRVQFTVSRETHDKLRRAQDLLRHSIPDGNPAAIFDRAVTLLVEHLERTKLAQSKKPRQTSHPVVSGSRHIPASVRRAVWARDAGCCAFGGRDGRCGETTFVEFHHVVPFARGGAATIDNIELRCRAHNQHEAVEEFGDRALFVREAPSGYLVNSVRTESLASCAAWPIIQGSSGRNPRGIRRSAARRFRPAVTAATRSG